jgi:hypothetical protein
MARKSPSRPIADHLELCHGVLCELTEETQALRLLGQLVDQAPEQGADFSVEVLISLDRLMAPHMREIERQLTRLDEALVALARLRKAA